MLLTIKLPNWATTSIDIVTILGVITAVIGVITALVKLSGARKANANLSNTQISLLGTMTEKLSDTRDLAEQVRNSNNQMQQALQAFETGLIKQREDNMKLASFVLECFNKSNLKEDTKLELKLFADKLFYDNNEQIIENLKVEQEKANSAISAGLDKIAELENKLQKERDKVTIAQENLKESRRV